MFKDLIVSKEISINASPEATWDTMTNPEKIKVYLFGTETVTDWKVGSPIVFQGEYQGHKYEDKGNVLENIPYEKLKYNYWSGFSGLEDKIENYFLVSYQIERLDDKLVKFIWTQEGFATKEGCEHTKNTLYSMLKKIKEISEAN